MALVISRLTVIILTLYILTFMYNVTYSLIIMSFSLITCIISSIVIVNDYSFHCMYNNCT